MGITVHMLSGKKVQVEHEDGNGMVVEDLVAKIGSQTKVPLWQIELVVNRACGNHKLERSERVPSDAILTMVRNESLLRFVMYHTNCNSKYYTLHISRDTDLNNLEISICGDGWVWTNKCVVKFGPDLINALFINHELLFGYTLRPLNHENPFISDILGLIRSSNELSLLDIPVFDPEEEGGQLFGFVMCVRDVGAHGFILELATILDHHTQSA